MHHQAQLHVGQSELAAALQDLPADTSLVRHQQLNMSLCINDAMSPCINDAMSLSCKCSDVVVIDRVKCILVQRNTQT